MTQDKPMTAEGGWMALPPRLARALTVAAVALLVACGSGGNGTSEPAPPSALGVVQVTVTDRYGAAVGGVQIDGPFGNSATDTQGVALVLTDVTGAPANVLVTRDSFVDKALTVASTPGQVKNFDVTLDRETLAAGGSLSSGSGVSPTLDASGRFLTFEVELVVVDGESRPINALNKADFTLRACVPDPANDRFDCVRGTVAADDVAYVPVTETPETLTQVPGGTPRPYATAMLMDQSGSIAQTDPTAARLFSAKAFLESLGIDDQVLLAAFAGGTAAQIPSVPLSVYGPFRGAPQARSYFDTLDTLFTQIGGNTPLYESIDTLRQQWLVNASQSAGLGQAIVLFTDGADTSCGWQEGCRLRRAQTIEGAVQDGVRIFSIGLSNDVDIAALGELANQTGGALLYADSVAQLVPLYGSVGQLMSLSLGTYRLRWTVRADSGDAFRPGQSLLGRVQVTAAGQRFDVPFVVGLP